MNWKTKALVQKIISGLPFSGRLNYFLQKYINRSLPMSNAVLLQKESAAYAHLQAFGGSKSEFDVNGVAFEFGAGYDLAIPLIFYHEGFKQQVVTDLNQLLKFNLVNNILERRGMAVELFKNREDLKGKTGIEYLSGVDARKTGFPSAGFSYIHSTDTLEHIPGGDILPILQECYRLLKPGGVISCIIDLQDHYQYFDESLSPFNFYRYSKKEWGRSYNNKLQYQNRLLAGQYYSLFAQAGFAPIQMELTKAGDAETEWLTTVKLYADFAKYSTDELNNLRCHIWAEKPD